MINMASDFNPLYLCNYDSNVAVSGDKFLYRLQTGQWSIENKNMSTAILATKLEPDSLRALLQTYLADQSTKNEVLHMALSAFLRFLSINWDSHPMPFSLLEYFGMEWPEDVDASTLLQRDSEPLYVNILYPELLYFSLQIISGLYQIEQQNLLYLWWSFRIKTTHQQVLEDDSAQLYSELEVMIARLSNESLNSQPLISKSRLRVLLYAEISQAYLLYRRVQKAEDFLVRARETVGLKLEMTGVLGKRTKFQQMLLPQLALSSELIFDVERPSAEESHNSTELPLEIELQDDVRLNKIEYTEKISQAELPSLEQTLCLLTVQYLQKAQPKDALMDEELLPYIQAVLAPKSSAWPTRVAALLVRSKLEANHKRTVERAMQQCETIVNDKTRVSDTSRLSYLWASGLQASWSWRQTLAALYLSLGLTKAALEEYRRLRLWEDVVVCYTMLQLRHKAAEVIQEQIAIQPTVKLYCLLGDATDEISWYEKAWEFSQHKSSRAQRHWGNYLFNRKLYTESIPHFERSLEINSIQDRVWLRLAYAALETENWDVSARAYRRYTYLQPNTFEAWNNLAKVYVKQGDKNRAYRALMESLRFNYDNWKLWENVIIISMDTMHLEDVMRAVHRLIDIRHQYEDLPVLGLLVRAVVGDSTDADGHACGRLRKRMLELFGRITSIHQNRPELWQMYADLSPTYLLKAQRLLKAYKGYTLSGSWANNPESSKQVVQLATNLLDFSLQARQEADGKDRPQADQLISSARLTGQAVIRAAEKQNWPETEMLLEQLRTLFNTVTEYMKSNS